MTIAETIEKRVESFLKEKQLYQLGDLPTEGGHALTKDLSHLAQTDVNSGLNTLKNVDLETLEIFSHYCEKVFELHIAIQSCLKEGGRIFLGGCGATGRLSIMIERLYRQMNPNDPDKVVGFMAGGDVAFVHSIEGFEDFPDYGARQLEELGFSENDLFLGITEGGETPFVIGATQRATTISKRKAFFLYCNPTEVLLEKVERSKKIIENPSVQNICLFTGNMALAGSTRMQASSVLMFAAGLGLLFQFEDAHQVKEKIDEFRDQIEKLDWKRLTPFVVAESQCYRHGDNTIYVSDDFFAVSVFTDTTERAPTFSLAAFDNKKFRQNVSSLTYVAIQGARSFAEGWKTMLLRSPRVLNWPEASHKVTQNYLEGFDFSEEAMEFRKQILPDALHQHFKILKTDRGFKWSFSGHEEAIDLDVRHPLLQHLVLKLLLNAHSTLVNGRLGRYESHFMTYVSPSNGKLIDRASRYVIKLLEYQGIKNIPYDTVVETLLKSQAEIPVNESVVLAAVRHLAT